MNLDTDLTPFTRINSKCIIDLNVKWKTKKLLEDNIGESLDYLVTLEFLVKTPKAQPMEKTVHK